MELQSLKPALLVTTLAGAVLVTLAVGAEAKEPQDYGTLTIQITGADGGHRTFVAASPDDKQTASYLVSELGMVTSSNVATADPPGLSDYYRLEVIQETGSTVPLPWTSLPSVEFYYYPGQGGVGFLRCRVGTGSRPDHEFWLVAFPAVQSLLEPHLNGLAPRQAPLAPLPLSGATPNPLPGLGVTLLALTLLVAAIPWLQRWNRPAPTHQRKAHPSLPG